MIARRPELRLLTSLEALLETRSVSQAADRLGVSQPAMSRTLARLRDQLGDPLLVRSRGGMVPTPRAEALAGPLRRWLTQGEDLLRPDAFTPGRLDRTFRVASTDFGILSVVKPAVRRITETAPAACLQISALSSASLKHLADGRLDLVIIGYPPQGAGVLSRRLFTERRLGLVREGHPVVGGEIGIDAFFEWPHVTPLVGEGFADPLEYAPDHLRRRRVAISAPSFSSVPDLVAESDALAVLPARAALHFAALYGLHTFEPPVDLPAFGYFMAWHQRSTDDAATQWLIEEIAAAQREWEASLKSGGALSA